MDRVDQVNARLPENERFNLLWWYAGKYQRFERTYNRIFPGSNARRRQYTLMAVGAVGLLLMFISLLPFLS